MPVRFANMDYPAGSQAVEPRQEWTVAAVRAGAGVLQAGGRPIPLAPGAVLCLPPETGCILTAGDAGLSLVCAFAPGCVAGREGQPLALRDDGQGNLRRLLETALDTCAGGGGASPAVGDALYDSVQYLLFSRQQPEQSVHVQKLRALLEENYTNPEYGVSHAVEQLPFCKDHIRRLFKKEMGLTPMAYLTELRLAQAKRLLRQRQFTRHSIAEISYQCGFYDPRYFARQFKRATGLTPKEFAQGGKGTAPGGAGAR